MLKGVKHPANSSRVQLLKSKFDFCISFFFHFGAAVAKIFNKYKEIFLKVFGNLEFVLLAGISKKKTGVLPKLDWSQDITGRVNTNHHSVSLFSVEIQAERTNSRFPKTF